MATDPKLKAALLKKLGVSPQALSQRAQKRKKQLPMSTEQAIYTIAHEEDIDISKYLDREETREVRDLVTALRNGGQPAATGTPRKSGGKTTTTKTVKVTIAGVDVGKIPALKPSHAEEAKRMAERVYPLVYIFENSVRDLIERVLKAGYGTDWWKLAVPPEVQKRAKKHKDAEQSDPWHGARGRREIDYVFLDDLWAIIKHCWGDFKALFPNQAWVQTRITSDMNVSRRVLAHMNPLAAEDIRGMESAFSKWVKQLQAVDDRLP